MSGGGAAVGRVRAAAGGLLVGVAVAALGLVAPAHAQASWETLIDGSSFQDRDALQAEWNFLYPWGSDHNGTARM